MYLIKITLIITVFFFGGCATIKKAKESSADLAKSLYTPNHYMSSTFHSEVALLKMSGSMGDPEKSFIFKTINIINFNYINYVTNLTTGKAAVNVSYDSLNLALTGGAAIATPASTKTGLAALGTFFQGQKQSVDKNIFNDQAIFALTSIMEIRRTAVMQKIRLSFDSSSYSLGQALLDIDEYYRAGSMQNALQASYLNQAKLTDSTQNDTSQLPASTSLIDTTIEEGKTKK